ncbi:MAG: J domain-containing protein [Henriciella sp.]
MLIYIVWPLIRKLGAWMLKNLDAWSPAKPEVEARQTGRASRAPRDEVWGDYSARFEQAFFRAQQKTGPQRPPPRPPVPPPAPPSPRESYLRTLGLSGAPDSKRLRSADRRLANKYHPDHYATAAHSEADRSRASRRMQKINEAYDWLTENP